MAATKKRAPARTKEQRENYIISCIMDLVEDQIRSGTVSSQVMTHFLKLGTTREKLQNEKLMSDLRVAEAKIAQMQQQDNLAELYKDAIAAMRSYQGNDEDDNYEENIF